MHGVMELVLGRVCTHMAVWRSFLPAYRSLLEALVQQWNVLPSINPMGAPTQSTSFPQRWRGRRRELGLVITAAPICLHFCAPEAVGSGICCLAWEQVFL